MKALRQKQNPVLLSDFPDPDIIRVGDTYYCVSTTMYFMPGGDLLRSYDLMNWEFVTHIFNSLEDNDAHHLVDGQNIYGRGMWAPTFRYYKGVFHLVFASNDAHKTYHFSSDCPEGPWKKSEIEGFYYDSSIFFDDDDRVYIVHGNRELRLTELSADLSGPKEGGLNRVVATDEKDIPLGYEGSHLYKKDGLYYLFTCHWLNYGSCRKSQVCLVSDSLTGEFKGRCIIDDCMGFRNDGVAQGGMVDTPDSDWYCFMFQDRGALGRSPVILPMYFDENNFPVIGIKGTPSNGANCELPTVVSVPSTRPDYEYAEINGDDDFLYETKPDGSFELKPFWQFNHLPDFRYCSVSKRTGAYRITSAALSPNIVLSQNTLAQRSFGPKSSAVVTIDGSGLNNGDFAALSALQGNYGMIALTKENDEFFLVMQGNVVRPSFSLADREYERAPKEYARIPVHSSKVTLKVTTSYDADKDYADFYYLAQNDNSNVPAGDSSQDNTCNDNFVKLGETHPLFFKLDHFTGCHFALSLCSTKTTGGYADFMQFRYLYD